jgi:hypothetical protein
MLNSVIRDTGVALPVDTVSGLDPGSQQGLALKYLQYAQRDTSRKTPQASLRFTGSITTIAKVNLHEQFSPTTQNGLTVVNGSPQVAGCSDHNLLVQSSWLGRLFHVDTDTQVYRVGSVDPGNFFFKLADFGGVEVNYNGIDRSTDTSDDPVDITDAYDADNTYATAFLYVDRYLLPENFKAPIGAWQNLLDPRILKYLPDEKFDRMIRDEAGSVVTSADSPTHYTIRTATTVDSAVRYYVEFWPIPDEERLYPFRYEGSPSIMKSDGDSSGYDHNYEDAILAKARHYIYRLLKNEPEQAAEEFRLWAEIVGDQQKNPLARTSVQMAPETFREHWEGAYDL